MVAHKKKKLNPKKKIKKKIKISVKKKTVKKGAKKRKIISKKSPKNALKKVAKKVLKKKVKPKQKSKPKIKIKKRVQEVVKKLTPLNLKRSIQNPIIQPSGDRYWDSKAAFNPTAVFHDGKVHIIYRAIGETDNSVLGYAMSYDGVSVSENFPHPIHFHFIRKNKDSSVPFISYSSGGGWGGGCEDPRITIIDDKAYLL